jgi:hypothetical protein
MKDILTKMPDNLNTEKDVGEYFKDAMKKINEKLKDEAKEKKSAKKVALLPAVKRGSKKEKEIDEEGNEIEIPVSNYTTFTKGHRPKVKAVISGLSHQEMFKVVAELWVIYKKFVIENKNVGDEKLAELWELHLEKLLEKIKGSTHLRK